MLIAQIENGAPTRIAPYRTMFPVTVFPDSGPTDEWLAENSCMKVNTFLAHDQNTQTLQAVTPYIQDGWVYTVEVRDLTAEELAERTESKAAQVRADRNRQLVESDWTQILDAPVDRTVWANYREALRRLPEQEGFPHNVVWPTKPE
jgi:hypothetical protein